MNPFRLLVSLFWSLRGLVLWGGLVVFILAAWCVFQRDAISDYFHSLDQRDQERARVDRLGDQVRELDREHERLEKDASFEHERVVRSRYHWSRPDERVLLLQSPDRPGETAAAPTTGTAPGTALPGGAGR